MEHSQYKLTVVTITYNDFEGFKKTFESLKIQISQSFDWVIVYAGNFEKERFLLKETNGLNVVIIEQKTGGIGSAFNAGVQSSFGDYVVFLNGGDIFYNEFAVKSFFDYLAHADVDVVCRPKVLYGDYVVSADGFSVERKCDHHQLNKRNSINHQSAFILRESLLLNPYDDRLLLGMDYDFWLKMDPQKDFHHLQKTISIFEQGGRSGDPEWLVHREASRYFLRVINKKIRITLTSVLGLLLICLKQMIAAQIKTLIGYKTYLILRK